MAKVMISLPDELLAAVDRAAKSSDQTRSGLIREALRSHLVESAGRDRRAAVRRLRRSFAALEGNPEELVRAERSR